LLLHPRKGPEKPGKPQEKRGKTPIFLLECTVDDPYFEAGKYGKNGFWKPQKCGETTLKCGKPGETGGKRLKIEG